MDTILAKQNNERVVKEYQCTRWAQPKLTGNLIVTTERVIFEGAAEKKMNDFNTGEVTTSTTDRIVEEAELKSVSGLSSFYGRKLNWIWLLLGIGGILGGIMGFIASIEILSSGWVPPELIAGGVFGIIFALGFIVLGIVILVKIGVWQGVLSQYLLVTDGGHTHQHRQHRPRQSCAAVAGGPANREN